MGRDPREPVIAHERNEEPADDGDLLHRGEGAAILRGRNLTDVGEREHAGRANREPP